MFLTDYKDILKRVEEIDPIDYGRTRNFIDGAVTYLSPYISRGVISTRFVMESILKRNYGPREVLKFLQELAWRDYFQNVWVELGDKINEDIKNEQAGVSNKLMPCSISEANTGIQAIDENIRKFYETGYLHNHLRMYVASLACNLGGSHWKNPARWMYYHLLDGDWASNALSWQWVTGAFSNKKYYANQENINKYCHTSQRDTFLDVPYDKFESINTPDELSENCMPELVTQLPASEKLNLSSQKPVLIYNYYNLDPLWKKDEDVNRVLLLEPSHFRDYPVAGKNIKFLLELASNIPGVQIFTGEFSQFINQYQLSNVYFKEHPLNGHYKGIQESREWMFDVKGYFPSFFKFWKKCEKQLDMLIK